ncbi:hypothetical protein M405DRAFT_931012 [Rhizopogon salebrosus TDB-379]|nr:hypothetical protein M405DRAFT_931012 [Rhizopogon salebrosus TDB-379]
MSNRGVPLPPFPATLISHPTVNYAYNRCLTLEAQADMHQSKPPSLLCARLLGYMLIHAPNNTGRHNVASDIGDCTDDAKLLELAQLYFCHFVRLFKSAEGPTPTPSRHPSRPSFDTRQAAIRHALEESPAGHRTAKANALARDNYRCLITGVYNMISLLEYTEIEHEARAQGLQAAPTQAAHIFPASTNKNITFMKNSMELHTMFDTLALWFEETDTPNTYRVYGDVLNLSNPMTFTTSDPVRLPLPSPRYLGIHAACCKVARLSGVGEYSDKVFRDMEDTRVLSFDGSSAELLSYALIHKLHVGPVF